MEKEEKEIKEIAVKLAAVIEGKTPTDLEKPLTDMVDELKLIFGSLKEQIIKSMKNIKEMYS